MKKFLFYASCAFAVSLILLALSVPIRCIVEAGYSPSQDQWGAAATIGLVGAFMLFAVAISTDQEKQ